jgi:serine/threonine-protein kinase RsbT
MLEPQWLAVTGARMTDFERILIILERHVSRIHARSVLKHALGEHRLSVNDFSVQHLAKIDADLERGLRLFTTDMVTNRALREVATLIDGRSPRSEPCKVEISIEADISRARNAARHMCEQLAAKSFSIQKVTTIVSELARNIVSYTHGGNVELAAQQEASHQRMIIRAADRGPGITNLAHVMSGEYRSRTGLGRGLIGTKRLADHFEITTGTDGTHVLAEVRL